MKIFKVTGTVEDNSIPPVEMFFQEERTANSVVNTFKQLAKLAKKKVTYTGEIIHPLSHKETYDQFLKLTGSWPEL